MRNILTLALGLSLSALTLAQLPLTCGPTKELLTSTYTSISTTYALVTLTITTTTILTSDLFYRVTATSTLTTLAPHQCKVVTVTTPSASCKVPLCGKPGCTTASTTTVPCADPCCPVTQTVTSRGACETCPECLVGTTVVVQGVC